ncbi:MAG TPA: DUF4142 domain-containing protein [Opitutaceae bacterium]
MKTHILKTALMLVPLCTAATLVAQTNGNADATANAPTAAPTQLSHADHSFALHLAMGSTNEVALAQLADTRAGSNDVKEFAQMMIQDHGKLNTQFGDLCQRKGVDIAEAIQKGQEHDLSDLSSKTGHDFDEAYVKMAVKAHKKTVDLLNDEIKDGKDSDMVAFANQALPIVQHHLEVAEQLEQKVSM